jgi:predicted transcriptional regulator
VIEAMRELKTRLDSLAAQIDASKKTK